jgi:hypothetical protein
LRKGDVLKEKEEKPPVDLQRKSYPWTFKGKATREALKEKLPVKL